MAVPIRRIVSVGAARRPSSLKGTMRQNHRYLKRIPLPNGGYRYIYPEDQQKNGGSDNGIKKPIFKPGRQKNIVNGKGKIEIKKTKKTDVSPKKAQSYINKGKEKAYRIFNSFKTSAKKAKEAAERYKKKIKKALGMRKSITFADGTTIYLD